MIANLTVQDLERLIQSSVSKALAAARDSDTVIPNNRLAYSEPQAASALGVKSHVLRDARLRGEIKATKVGGRHAYMRDDLVNYLEGNKS
ncbi:helix-turn-helix domain-containing protein [Lacipirellula sp.]|uniref:helix-turn-helix domain-containing protein n=1 Tax=Lacipirellula sp. TaxID=2691419 RepID=UPI003D14D42B